MSGYVKATPPGQWPGPARFGLTQEQWRRVMYWAWEFENRGQLIDFPGETELPKPEPTNRLRFARYLLDTGRLGRG